MTVFRKAILGCLVFLVVTAISLLVTYQTLKQPVSGDKDEFTATISDVSGLSVGNDVRKLGVPVGKVLAIDLVDGNAKVRFNVQQDHPVYENTGAAVRYLSLVGQRYVDLTQDAPPTAKRKPGSNIPLEQTLPSFNVTTLLNGLRPLYSTLDPASLNELGENLLKVIQGDGSGLTPVLQQLETLTKFASDREAVITVLMENLARVSDALRGKSSQLNALVTNLNKMFATTESKVDGINESLSKTQTALESLVQIGQSLERSFDNNAQPLNSLFQKAVPGGGQIVDILRSFPAILAGLNQVVGGSGGVTGNLSCSRGAATIPPQMNIFLAGNKVVVCQ